MNYESKTTYEVECRKCWNVFHRDKLDGDFCDTCIQKMLQENYQYLEPVDVKAEMQPDRFMRVSMCVEVVSNPVSVKDGKPVSPKCHPGRIRQSLILRIPMEEFWTIGREGNFEDMTPEVTLYDVTGRSRK